MYPVIKCGPRAGELLHKDAVVEMKISHESETSKDKSRPMQSIDIDISLQNKLLALRNVLAKKQKIPAYAIVHNSTITDMCIKLPTTLDEFMEISGVGQAKMERYGNIFIDVITEHLSKDNENAMQKDEATENKASNDTAIEVSKEPVTVSAIADRINCLFILKDIKKLTGAKINEWLLNECYISVAEDENGNDVKLPTKQGEAIGISTENRNIRGKMCMINLYNENAQKMIIDYFTNIKY
jgi:ATP-dependent DNA helicase RecQ